MITAPETNRATRAYEVVADELLRADVKHIFGVLGDDTAPVVVASVARGIAYHAARHENHAVAMADAYSRTTGRMGVAALTGGPGFTNALTAIYTAHRAGSRVLVLTGAGRAEEDDHEPEIIRRASGSSWLKHFPQADVLRVAGVETVRPLSANTLAADAAHAVSVASTKTVVAVLGRELLLENAPPRMEQDSTAAPVGDRSATAAPDPEKIGELADFLQETWAVKQPLIIAGRGAVEAGAGPALRKLAHQIGALLSTSLRARGLFRDDPFSIGVCGSYSTSLASELITQSDCVLAFGASLNPWTTYKNTLFPKALLVQIDSDEAALDRFLPSAIAIHGDTRAVAEALVAELDRRGHVSPGCRSDTLRASIASFRKDAEVVDRSTADQIDPRILMLALDRMLPAERILCVDSGQQARFAIRYIDTTGPQNLVQLADAGSIGLGFGNAIGAAIGRPNELVVLAVGDGAAMMSLGDLETAVRLRLPLLIVVSNDESYGAEVNALVTLGMDTRLADTPCPSFEAMAVAMGARAATVRKVADLGVIEEWLTERPALPLVLDCRVNPAVRTE